MLICDRTFLAQIQGHSERAYPHECCGLLLGSLATDTQPKQVREVRGTQNVWNDHRKDISAVEATQTCEDRYWIDPNEVMAAQKYARAKGWDIIGIYHSHPDHVAVPSECDRQWAWPHYSYVIVSVNSGAAHDVQSWVLDDQHRFQPEVITAR
uniref:M67 family metallopeptidase n=1 Tax=Petrachloros mirabilis TaxID=2918835 RepID=UPI003083FC56